MAVPRTSSAGGVARTETRSRRRSKTAAELQPRPSRGHVSGLDKATSIDGAFALLDEVAQPSTQWSIVYDLRNRAVTYRTAANREKRSIRFADLDFACAAPVRVLDVDRGRGNVVAQFSDYTRDANESLVRRATKGTSFTRDTPEAEIVEAARWPERSAGAR